MSRRTIDDVLREARSKLDRLEPLAALAAQQAGALIVDTRSADERRRSGVIPGSLHVPLSVLEWRLDPDVDPAFRNPHVEGLDQQILLVCAHGYSSSLAAVRLRELGFSHATDVVGGFAAWSAGGLPVGPAMPDDPNAMPGMGGPEPS
jgi:rhodanese-related sulfurtransferase